MLYQLLEDYFYLRGLWFRGSKLGFQWMKSDDPITYRLFAAALEPGASDEALQSLVESLQRVAVPRLEG